MAGNRRTFSSRRSVKLTGLALVIATGAGSGLGLALWWTSGAATHDPPRGLPRTCSTTGLELGQKGVPTSGAPLTAVPNEYLVLVAATSSGEVTRWLEPLGPARLYRWGKAAWRQSGELPIPAPGTKPVAPGSPAVVAFSGAQADGMSYVLAVTFRELPGHPRLPGHSGASNVTLCRTVDLETRSAGATTVPAG